MSVDPKTLKEGDQITFGRRITRQVYAIDNDSFLVVFADGGSLADGDPLWELAELVSPELPTEFSFGYLGIDNNYHADFCVYTPENLLKLLKQDVAALEAGGVKEEEE